MKIVLAGAAGNLGLALTARLLADQHALTALDSRIEPLNAWRDQLAGLHAVDLRDAQTLAGRMDGADLVISTVGIGRPQKLSDYQQVDYQGNLNLLRAAQAARVGRFIYTSVARVDSDRSVPLLSAKYAFEQALKQSGLQWLVIRPSGYFTDIWRTFMGQARKGRITLIRTREPYRFSPIHPADVADFVARNLTLSGQNVLLGGPQDFTYAEISALCFDLLGQPARIQRIPLPVFNGMLLLLRAINPPLYGVMSFLRWASTTDLTAPHVGTQTVRDYLLKELQAQ